MFGKYYGNFEWNQRPPWIPLDIRSCVFRKALKINFFFFFIPEEQYLCQRFRSKSILYILYPETITLFSQYNIIIASRNFTCRIFKTNIIRIIDNVFFKFASYIVFVYLFIYFFCRLQFRYYLIGTTALSAAL